MYYCNFMDRNDKIQTMCAASEQQNQMANGKVWTAVDDEEDR
jgi:hypothetical protein